MVSNCEILLIPHFFASFNSTIAMCSFTVGLHWYLFHTEMLHRDNLKGIIKWAVTISEGTTQFWADMLSGGHFGFFVRSKICSDVLTNRDVWFLEMIYSFRSCIVSFNKKSLILLHGFSHVKATGRHLGCESFAPVLGQTHVKFVNLNMSFNQIPSQN